MHRSLQSTIIAIKNAQNANKAVAAISFSNLHVLNLLHLLWVEGYINGFTVLKKESQILVYLKYISQKPMLNNVKHFKSSSYLNFLSVEQIKLLKSTFCLVILSTTEGLLDAKTCLKRNLGGKILFLLW
jgi:ribosomal protein S8